MDEEQVVRPRKGRVSAFTSGKENPHRVERVTGMSFSPSLSSIREMIKKLYFQRKSTVVPKSPSGISKNPFEIPLNSLRIS